MTDLEKKGDSLNSDHDEARVESQTIDQNHGEALHRVYNIWTGEYSFHPISLIRE